jgi:MFS family permease
VRSSLLAASSLLTALVWVIALVVDSSPFHRTPTVLIGVGMLTSATVATVGMIVVGGRWAHRLGLTAVAMTLVLALAREIDFWWVLGMITTAGALLALLSPAVISMIRKLPSASGPPPRAIAPPMVLLVAPTLLGFVGNDAAPWALLTVALTAPLAAFFYSRVTPGGLIGIRVIWPAVALGMAPLMGWVAGPTAAGLAVAVAVTAWDASVKASYHPPREVGTTFPMPPELAPREIRDAARIDERGRRA